MPAQREFRIFISAVSGELKSYRGEVARVLRRKELEVRDQEHFRQGPATLLQQLSAYIQKCDAVIFLVGERAGAFPSDDQVSALGAIPIFEQYRQESGQPRASYTQWEFLLAKHYGKHTYVFFTGKGFSPGNPDDEAADSHSSQTAYRQWIIHKGEHREGLETAARLIEDVLVLPFPDLSRAKPIDLPYPPLGNLFKGRDDFLRDLHKSLTRGAGRTAIVSSALYGLGGVGKTRAAVEYAWAHQDDYSALLFVIAETPEALRRNLAALARPLVLNLPEHKADEEEIRIKAVLDWLKEHPTWLLILDNLDTPEALAEAERLMGRLSGGHILVTSRLSNFAGNFDSLPLDVLTIDDAAAFLLDRTKGRRQKSADDASAARSLAVELGQLALALEQAGAYIARGALSFAGYHQLWLKNWSKVVDWADEKITKYPRSVAVTWQTSINQIGLPARRLLERLAWLAPEPVPDFLLAIPVSGVAVDDLGDAVADLAEYSLVRRNPEKREFSVHRLVQDVTRRSLSGDDSHTALMQALTWLADVFTGDADDLVELPKMERLVPHVLAAAECGNGFGIAEPTASLSLLLAELLWHRVTLAEIEPLCRRALAIRDRLTKSVPGNADWQHDRSAAYEWIGKVQVEQGDLAGALKSFQDSLAIRDRLANSNPANARWQRDLYSALWFVADIEMRRGDLNSALKKLIAGRMIMERLTNSDPNNAAWQRDLSVAMNKVGDVQMAQNDLAGALKSYSDILAIRDRLAESDPGNAGWQHDLSVSYIKVGNVLVAQDDLAGALKSYRDGLAIADRLAKSDPGNAGWQRELSVAYNFVGNAQLALGDMGAALSSYQADCAIMDRVVKTDPGNAGWQHDLSLSYAKLARVFMNTGKNEKALDTLRDGRAIMVRMTSLSPDNAVWKRDLAWFDSQIAALLR